MFWKKTCERTIFKSNFAKRRNERLEGRDIYGKTRKKFVFHFRFRIRYLQVIESCSSEKVKPKRQKKPVVTPRQPLGDNSSTITATSLSFLLSPKARLITSCRGCLYLRFSFKFSFPEAPRLIRFRAQDKEQINERIEFF